MIDAVFMLGQIPIPLALVVSVNDVHDDGDQYSISVEMRRDLLSDHNSYMAEFPVFPRGDAATAHNLMAELVDVVAAYRNQPLILSTDNVTVEFHPQVTVITQTCWGLFEVDGDGRFQREKGRVNSEQLAREWEGGNGFRTRRAINETREIHNSVASWEQSCGHQRILEVLNNMSREDRRLLDRHMDALPQLLMRAN